MPQSSSTDIEIDPTTPVRLTPVHIPKPWGQEIWYTGMEERGESQVLWHGQAIPLSHYLATDSASLTRNTDVLLLKVLDPAPEEVTGDLYFEVHEHKQEVYVVTAIDPAAWPDGCGGIRFGMNQQRRAEYADDNAFRAAYQQAVRTYETVRRQIDAGDDNPDLAARELAARDNMEAFTQLRKLQVADVVRVPTWTPHALQHGVRVVEFQTPTYERLIISFAQKVLTQDHWDTPLAVASMHLEAPAPETFVTVRPGIEQIASFTDFNVWRVDLAASGGITLPHHIPYAVCMSLTDGIEVGNLTLQAEEACFVPAAALPTTQLSAGHASVEQPAANRQLLVAAPGL